jgi:hypothetical protein
MTEALARLKDAHAVARNRESEAERVDAYKVALAARSELDAELQAVYPELAGGLADLVHRLHVCNAHIGVVNGHRSAGAPVINLL